MVKHYIKGNNMKKQSFSKTGVSCSPATLIRRWKFKAFEHKVLNFAFHTCKKVKRQAETTTSDILKAFSAKCIWWSIWRVAKAFKKLNENTALYLLNSVRTVKSIIMGQLFPKIELVEDGADWISSDLGTIYF